MPQTRRGRPTNSRTTLNQPDVPAVEIGTFTGYSLGYREPAHCHERSEFLTQQQFEAHVMSAADILHGRSAWQEYKSYILSLMFYKRLCDL